MHFVTKLKTHLFFLLIVWIGIGCSSVIDTVTIYSPSMKKDIPNIVILPSNYKQDTQSYPTVFLLHGATGEYSDWLKRVPAIKEYANKYKVIIVLPDGGYTSWYFNSPIDSTMQYETYITQELIPYVDTHYRTHPKQRAISGLSMGGHGAFYLALKHPNLFIAAGSLSGGMDIRPFSHKWDIAQRLGALATFPKRWDENSVTYLMEKNAPRQTAFIFDCGMEDFFIEVNRNLHKIMRLQGIKHTYMEQPGGHSWSYWSQTIENHFLFFSRHFNQPTYAPK